jgi:hypothetical protein
VSAALAELCAVDDPDELAYLVDALNADDAGFLLLMLLVPARERRVALQAACSAAALADAPFVG